MSKQEEMPTWWEITKGMPAYTAENWRLFVAYWKAAPLREWIVQLTWLAILVGIFYYGTHGVVYTMHAASDAGVDPNSPIGILLFFVFFLPIIAIFVGHWIFSAGVRIIFKWLDGS